MFVLRLNKKYFCAPDGPYMLIAPSGWNQLKDCVCILHSDSHAEAEVFASRLRALGGSYRGIEVVKLTEEEEEFLSWLRLKQDM